MSQSTGLQLQMRQRFLQSKLQYVRLLEMDEPEVEDAVRLELLDNPALESKPADEAASLVAAKPSEPSASRADDTPYYRLHVRNHGADWEMPDFAPAAEEDSLVDSLSHQIGERELSPEVEQAALFIVGSLDANGYLRRSEQNIIDDLAFTTGTEISHDTFRKAFETVRDLEPYGVGATDLRDCLLLQVDHLPESESRDDARNILEHFFEALSLNHIHRIVRGLRLPQARVDRALRLIRSLNPKPGASLGGVSTLAPTVIPDFIVSNEEGRLTLTLNDRLPELVISESYAEAVKRMERNADKRRRAAESKDNKEILNRFRRADDFIGYIRQRRETLFAVMTAILETQRDYFLSEDVADLRPMTIREIAERTGYDISVVSRATARKYVATQGGILPLKFFFSGELGTEGNEFTNKQVQDAMRRLVEAEDKRHPLTDEKLRSDLAAQGFDISRRTVAKYRDRLGIPVARLRRRQ